MQVPAALQGLYTLLERPEATHRSVLKTHRQQTLEAMAHSEGVVLTFKDHTELGYSGYMPLRTYRRHCAWKKKTMRCPQHLQRALQGHISA